ncbi:MAG: SDR family NAD(P)-dependent oxidoreductase, partial [Verrucomicrobiales bacterium]|nr:SDR family NAD(P)-dependent oxidoreductase [Verrucomicrobiales bacterium]
MNPDEPAVQQLFDLQGRCALVTGASGYLGGAFARALAEAGATVIVGSRDAGRAASTASELPSAFGQIHCGVALDYLDENSIEAGVTQAVDSVGQIDILVNNGHAADAHDLTNVKGEDFNRQLANAT